MDRPASPSPNIFRHRDWRLFWSTRFLSTLAVQAESVSIGWQVYDAARRAHHTVEQGAFLVGMVESFSSVYLGGSTGALVLFVLLLAVLLVRPSGLFGRETRSA